MRIGKRHRECTFENYKVDDKNKSAYLACLKISETISSLILSGPVGTGKTHLLVSVAYAVDNEQRLVEFWPMMDLTLKLRQNFDDSEPLIDSLHKCKLLILDDLGAERTTDYILETIESIVDYRYRQCRSTLIGTNLTMDEMAARYGNRVLSRWMGDGKFVRITGADRRLEPQC